MCGRYSVTAPMDVLVERFQAELPSQPVEARYNAAPSQNLPVLLNDGERQIQLLRWGLIPHWAKDTSNSYKMINARAETLEEKATFREPFQKRRCLVLADGFYEWKQTDKGKIPMRFTLKSGEPFAMAGLWENWKSPDGELIRSFTVITGQPNELVTPVHNRMPMMLLPDYESVWLDNGAGDTVWRDMLRPYPAELMQVYPVSARLNATTNNDPSLIARLM